MSNSWDDMRKAKEESYFDKKNREALERMSKKQQEEKPRLSPVSGAAMEQVVINGVVVDRDPVSGGIWLDAGELEQLLSTAQNPEGDSKNWLTSFVKGLSGK